MKKKYLLLLLTASIFLFSGCSEDNNSSNKISLGLMSDTAAIPFILADQAGYYESLGINVEIQIFQSAVDRDSALQANAVNAVSSDLIASGFFKESDNSLRITSKSECGYAILSSPESNIANPLDLQGKQIGLSTNTLMEYLVDLTIEKYSIPDVTKTNIAKMPARLEMLRENQIDAATLPDPLTFLAQKNNSSVIVTNEDLGVYPGVILFDENFALKHKALISKFYEAYDKAVDEINANGIDRYIESINQVANFPEPVLSDLNNLKYAHSSLPSEENVNSAMEWLHAKGFISEFYAYEDMILSFE